MANIFDEIRETFARDLEQHLDKVTGEMSQDMRDKLAEGDHIDTGQLIDSIHNNTARSSDGEAITSTISIDATDPRSGAWYAEFLEYGTGLYNETGDGRKTPWKWKPQPGSKYYQEDDNGNPIWYTTVGMKPHPFIRPSISAHLGELEQGIEYIYGNLKRYRG